MQKKGWIDPTSLGNYDRIAQENIHAKIVGLTALAASRLGFWIEVETKWPLETGKRKLKYRPDLI